MTGVLAQASSILFCREVVLPGNIYELLIGAQRRSAIRMHGHKACAHL